MTDTDKKELAHTYLQNYTILREHQRNRSRLFQYLSKDAGGEYSEILSDMQEMTDTFHAKHAEVISALNALPDTKGKTALFAHYVLEEPYKCLAVDLKVSDRHLIRLVDYALVQLADFLTSEKMEVVR